MWPRTFSGLSPTSTTSRTSRSHPTEETSGSLGIRERTRSSSCKPAGEVDREGRGGAFRSRPSVVKGGTCGRNPLLPASYGYGSDGQLYSDGRHGRRPVEQRRQRGCPADADDEDEH